MDTTLRPLSLGEVLDRTFQLYRKHFLMFAGIASFAAGIDLVWRFAQTTTERAVQYRVGAATLSGVNLGFSLVSALLYIIVSAVAMAAISRAVSAIYLGRPTGIALAYHEVKPHWLRYIGLYIVAVLASWGPTLAIFAGFLIIAFAIQAGTNAIAGGIIFVVLFLGLLLTFPFGIWMMLRYSLANQVCVFEDLGIRASLKRSVNLSRGGTQKLSILVMFFLVWLISAILTYAGLTPFMYVLFRAIYTHGRPALSIGMTIYTLLVQFVVAAITIPLYSIGLTLFYYDARIRKEGFDVEWLLQQATSDVPPPPPPAAETLPAESPGQA